MATQTRERLLDAARIAFATRGVDGTPITDLEEAAGLAHGSGGFYRYFKTKEEILEAVVRREIDRVVARQEAEPPVVPEGDAHAQLERALADGLDRLRSLAPLMSILAREGGRIPTLAKEVAERLLEGGLRHDADRLGALVDADPSTARVQGAIVMSALVGYELATAYFGQTPGAVSPQQLVSGIVDLLLPATASTPEDISS